MDEKEKNEEIPVTSNDQEKIEIPSEEKVQEVKEEVKEQVKEEQKTEEKAEGNKQEKVKKSVGTIIFKTIIWAIILILIAIIIRALVFKKYDVLGYRFYLIGSGSMEPTISIGDAVAVKEAAEYNEGDVVAFSESNMIIVHRITKVYTEDGKKMFETKGDNNNVVDGGLRSQENILGKYVFKFANVGNAITFIKNNIFIIAIVIIVLIVAIIVKELIV